MAEGSSRARRGFLLRALFEILLGIPDGLPAAEALAKLVQTVELTAHEAADYAARPGIRRFERDVRFTSIPFVKAGWLRKEKGRWSVTPDGADAYHQFTDPETFLREAVRRYRAWARTRPTGSDDADDETTAPVITTLEEAEEAASGAIRDYLQGMSPYGFQELIAALLRALGYFVLWVAPPGPDRGIDILATTDALGIQRPRIKIQVKRHADRQRVDAVRAFQAVLGDHDVGIFVNTGGFTSDAAAEARGHPQRPVTVLDADDVVRLWIDHQARLTYEQRELLPLKAVYYLQPPT